jgi:hypothetical protein
VITIVAVLVFLCHHFDFQRIYEKVKQALLNFKDIAADVVVVSGAVVIVDVTVDVVTTDNGFIVVTVLITGIVVLVLLQHRLDFRRIYEKASSD